MEKTVLVVEKTEDLQSVLSEDFQTLVLNGVTLNQKKKVLS